MLTLLYVTIQVQIKNHTEALQASCINALECMQRNHSHNKHNSTLSLVCTLHTSTFTTGLLRKHQQSRVEQWRVRSLCLSSLKIFIHFFCRTQLATKWFHAKFIFFKGHLVSYFFVCAHRIQENHFDHPITGVQKICVDVFLKNNI